METIEYKTVDKSAWPDGVWMDEPDHVQWPDQVTGLPCLAHRDPRSGHWCGYVGVASGHPYYEKGYEDVPVDVHWGLTYAAFCQQDAKEGEGICHIPGPGEPDKVWWLGFDCAHSGDLSPAYDRNPGFHSDETYKDLWFVQAQCKNLAAQLSAVQGQSDE